MNTEDDLDVRVNARREGGTSLGNRGVHTNHSNSVVIPYSYLMFGDVNVTHSRFSIVNMALLTQMSLDRVGIKTEKLR